MNIGKNIKEIRKAKNIKSKDLAKKLNIAPSTLSSYENNKNNVSIEMLKKIAQVLNVPTDLITNGIHKELKKYYTFKDIVKNNESIQNYYSELHHLQDIQYAEKVEIKENMMIEMIKYIAQLQYEHRFNDLDLLFNITKSLIQKEILQIRNSQFTNKTKNTKSYDYNNFLTTIENTINPPYKINIKEVEHPTKEEQAKLKKLLPEFKKYFEI